MVMSEGPELDDEVGRPPGHLAKDDGSGGLDSKTYQAGVSRVCKLDYFPVPVI